jgi:dihydrofolate reductase
VTLKMETKIIAIVARDRNNIIGANNDLPWRLSSDLKRFKALTMGKPMIMGRKTWDSIGRPLPGREIIVLTRDMMFRAEGAHLAATPAQALATAKRLAKMMQTDEIIVAGGGDIFRAFLECTDRIEITEVALDIDGDARFPDLDLSQWEKIHHEHPMRGPKDDADFHYVTLERRKAL